MGKGLDRESVTTIDSSIWNVQTGDESSGQVTVVQEETSNSEETIPENGVFLAYFNLFYFMGLIPFKIEYDSTNNVHSLHSNSFQKICCAFAHGAVLLVQSFVMYTSSAVLFLDGGISIVAILEFCSNVASIILTMFTMRFHWWKQSQFLQLVERLTHYSKPRTNRCLKFLVVICMITYIGQSLTMTLFMYHDTNHYGNPYQHIKKSNLTNSSVATLIDTSPTSPFSIFLYITFAYCFLYYFLSQGIFLLLVVCLRRLGTQLQTQMVDRTCAVSKGMRLYRKLKETTDFIQRVYGNMLVLFYVTSVAYFAEAPYILMGKRGDAEKTFFIFFLVGAIVWILAAEFHFTVQAETLTWARIYLNKDESTVTLNDRLKLLDISQQVAADPVALSCKYFTVTYHHISLMLKNIVTYGIIVFQIHEGQQS